MTNKKYDKEFKDSLAKLYLEEGRTVESISKEYSVSRSTITNWVKTYKEECDLDDEKISPSVYEENGKFKNEHLNHYTIKNILHLDELTNDYIFRYYHQKRPHSSLGGLTPFEKRYS